MSFILDALKKAESERNRAAGPVLMNVRIVPPRRRLPAWAWVLGCVLLANLAVLAWLLLRTPQASTAAAAAAAAANPASAASTPAATYPSGTSSAAPAAGTGVPPAATVYATPAPTLPTTSFTPPPAATSAANIATTRPAAPPTDLATLPTLQDVVAAGVNLPALVMNMHVYDPTPAQRYVLLNGTRLIEGEFTADGIKVEAITERGAVLEALGHRFLLVAGGG
jgi:general secretion pathway protein B